MRTFPSRAKAGVVAREVEGLRDLHSEEAARSRGQFRDQLDRAQSKLISDELARLGTAATKKLT
jgi:hypothetical protein